MNARCLQGRSAADAARLVPTLVQGPFRGTVMELDEKTLLLSTGTHLNVAVTW